MRLEHALLGLLAGLTLTLLTSVLISPPPGDTAAPRASLADLGLPDGSAARGRETVGSSSRLVLSTAAAVAESFQRLDYDLESVLAGRDGVPRLFLSALPRDLGAIREIGRRKALFFQAMLPLVLRVNEQILADRRRLWQIRHRLRVGERVSAVDRLWLTVMADRYGVRRDDLGALAVRVDIIPPSLALAQAAEESGWGTSRFAREGNAMFGEWTFSRKAGLKPRNRDRGANHRVRAFDTVTDSVRAYAHNLNTHRAYREFRAQRAALRRQGRPLNGAALAGTLHRYSQRGEDYVAGIRALISVNNLSPLDGVRLRPAESRPKPAA